MSKELPYFKFHVSEWLNGDIMLCSFAAQGLFTNICAYYWHKSGDITPEKIIRRFKCSMDLIDELLEESIIDLNDNKINISFLDEQMIAREPKAKSSRKNGQLGGRPKKPNDNLTDNLTETKTITYNNPIKKREEKKRKELLFSEWWDLYNKKIGTGKAKDKFLKLPLETIQKIIESTPEYVKSTPDEKYRKNPETWLNQQCWLDESSKVNTELIKLPNSDIIDWHKAPKEWKDQIHKTGHLCKLIPKTPQHTSFTNQPQQLQ